MEVLSPRVRDGGGGGSGEVSSQSGVEKWGLPPLEEEEGWELSPLSPSDELDTTTTAQRGPHLMMPSLSKAIFAYTPDEELEVVTNV